MRRVYDGFRSRAKWCTYRNEHNDFALEFLSFDRTKCHITTTIDKNKSRRKKITNRRLGLKKIVLWTVLALHISCTCKITLLTKIICLWYLVLGVLMHFPLFLCKNRVADLLMHSYNKTYGKCSLFPLCSTYVQKRLAKWNDNRCGSRRHDFGDENSWVHLFSDAPTFFATIYLPYLDDGWLLHYSTHFFFSMAKK